MQEGLGSSGSELQVMEPFGITVDEEGIWFYLGSPIIREDILGLFYEHLKFIPGHGYAIAWQGGLHPITVADTPFVLTRVDPEEDGQGVKAIWISLKHLPDRELLDPSTLFIGKNNVLYCKVRGGNFLARFSRPAYYQIAQLIEEEKEGSFVIKVRGKTYKIEEASTDELPPGHLPL